MQLSVDTKRKYVRLSESEWSLIRKEWEAGSATLAELSDRFGASIRSLQNHFDKHGTVKGSTHRAELTDAVRLAVSPAAIPAADTSREAVQAATLRQVHDIEEAVAQQLAIAKADPTQAFRASSTVKMLLAAVDVVTKSYALKRQVLGLDQPTEDSLPVLVIRDLTEQDIAGVDDNDDEILDESLHIEGEDDDIVFEEAA